MSRLGAPTAALLLGVGCGPNPLLGDWELARMDFDGLVVDFPVETVEDDAEGLRTTRVEMFVSVPDIEAGVLPASLDTFQYTTTDAGTAVESLSEPISFQIEARRAYQMRGQALGGALTMYCVVEEALDCVGTLFTGGASLNLDFSATSVDPAR